MSEGDERQHYLELPLPERTMVVALRHVFEQIRKIQNEEVQQIQSIHQSFMDKFKESEEKASKYIRGGPITAGDLKNKQVYFSNDQLGKVEALIKANKGIEAYWLTVLLNYFRQDLSQSDKQIAAAILDISTNITQQKIELVFEIGNNLWLAAGKYTRIYVVKDGIPYRTEGSKTIWLQKQPEGVLSMILRDNLKPDEVLNIFPNVGEIINEVVPYSLEYFLGVAQEQEESQEEEQEGDEDQQEDEDEEDQGPNKKVKQ